MTKHKTPVQSIKQYCKHDCCCNDLQSWKFCTRTICPLYPYRLGKRPKKQADSPINKTKNEPPKVQEQLP